MRGRPRVTRAVEVAAMLAVEVEQMPMRTGVKGVSRRQKTRVVGAMLVGAIAAMPTTTRTRLEDAGKADRTGTAPRLSRK
jgi:hypothetical protein